MASTILAQLGGAVLTIIQTEFDANKAALVAEATSAGGALVNKIAAEIEAALPTNGILANIEKSTLDPILTNIATQLAAQLPNAATAVATEIDAEIAQLIKDLG